MYVAHIQNPGTLFRVSPVQLRREARSLWNAEYMREAEVFFPRKPVTCACKDKLKLHVGI